MLALHGQCIEHAALSVVLKLRHRFEVGYRLGHRAEILTHVRLHVLTRNRGIALASVEVFRWSDNRFEPVSEPHLTEE